MSIIDEAPKIVYRYFMGEDKRQRLLKLALDIFFQHGYRRVEMKEIAEAAGISRPGLYLYFKTKEEIFNAAILQYSDSKILEISKNIAGYKTNRAQLEYAFDVWCVRGFERTLKSPEAREVSDCSLEFARAALEESYQKFEVVVTSVLKSKTSSAKKSMPAEATAHLLVSSTRGFKLVARSGAELRKLISDLIGIVI
jgi:AcrR family transcriptional regulator